MTSLHRFSPSHVATVLDHRTRPLRRRARLAVALAAAPLGRADVALFHELRPPPGGGGNQFLRALRDEVERRGLRVELNRLSRGTPACLYNSFNFDFARLRAFARDDARMVHRVDGPIGRYRGEDDATDRRIWELNHELAHATVFQSGYSLDAHRELGLEFRNPVVIRNAVDPAIFHPGPPRPLGRRIRLVSSGWSLNANKGAETLAWLARTLDPERYALTFVGRTDLDLGRARVVPPVDSGRVGAILREHDVYVAPSLHDACSNSLLEALACGLPGVYVRSGGHPELVGDAGLGWDDREELPELLDRLVDEYEQRRAAIFVPSLADVADRYLEVLGVGA